MKKKILHITDFHLNDFEGDKELIRRKYFEEYIDKLINSLNQDGVSDIDYLVLTGDFVDIGKIENFKFVQLIVAYICKKLNIPIQNVCCTIGNHDYKWKEELADFSNSSLLRKPFKEFIKPYNAKLIFENERFFLKDLENNYFFLSLDSTLFSKDGAPGKIETGECDTIVNDQLKAHLNENSTLLVGCHFPITSSSNNFLAIDEPNWHENHVWIQASPLHDRIKNLKTKNTIWFHGDVHASDKTASENNTYILTGRFSGDIQKQSSFPRQCVLIEIEDDNLQVITYSYTAVTHKDNAQLGNWVSSGLKSIREVIPAKGSSSIKIDPSPTALKIIDLEIENQIIENISQDLLYKFGRFKTSEKYSSLGWVNVNKLVNSSILLSRITEKSFKYINEITQCKNSKCILIGLEVIGGIIASQISVRCNSSNYILPVRGHQKFYSTEETNTTELNSAIADAEEAVIFIDVVASGKTMSEFVSKLFIQNSKIKIHIISIISNNIHFLTPHIEGATTYGTFCNKLKIPLIENENLPEESIFGSTLDFT